MHIDYSDIAEYYDKVRITSPEYLNFWSSRIIQYGNITKDSRVLDIGCGTGRFSITMARITGAEIHGIDPSGKMLEKALKKDRKGLVRWNKALAEQIPYPSQYFDCVYMTFVFHQIKYRKIALKEMRRVLKPGGRIVIMTTSHAHIKRSPLYMFPGLAAIDLARFPTLPEFKNILKRAGFRDVHYHLDKYKNRRYSIDDFLKRVRNKHISTLSVFSEGRFQEGYRIFEEKLRHKYKDYVEIPHGVNMVSGEK